MVSNEMICKCKQVSYLDVENALHEMTCFEDVLQAFDEVQKITHCSTGCGGRSPTLFGSEVHGNIPPQHLRFPVGIRIRCQRRHHLIHQLKRQILMGHFTAAKCQSDL